MNDQNLNVENANKHEKEVTCATAVASSCARDAASRFHRLERRRWEVDIISCEVFIQNVKNLSLIDLPSFSVDCDAVVPECANRAGEI